MRRGNTRRRGLMERERGERVRAAARFGRRGWSARLPQLRRPSWRRVGLALALCLALVWALLPALRGVTLVATAPLRGAPDAHAAGLDVEDVRFPATDGTRLAVWLVLTSARAPSIILVHGFK